ncbi:IS66 family transposase [Sinorhizobium fredii]|uniref:IS66 family transposase n=1 Tax=Rhizobium fredii TaxID=380 RepID=UPI0035190FE7
MPTIRPFRFLIPDAGRPKTGRLWIVVRDERPRGSTAPPTAFHAYSSDRKGDRARHLLSGVAAFYMQTLMQVSTSCMRPMNSPVKRD